MYTISVPYCTGFTAANNGADISTCPPGSLVYQYIEVPEFVDYQNAFIQFDPDIMYSMFGATLTMFAVGVGVGWMIRILKLRRW